jgi:hypothetical protein
LASSAECEPGRQGTTEAAKPGKSLFPALSADFEFTLADDVDLDLISLFQTMCFDNG